MKKTRTYEIHGYEGYVDMKDRKNHGYVKDKDRENTWI